MEPCSWGCQSAASSHGSVDISAIYELACSSCQRDWEPRTAHCRSPQVCAREGAQVDLECSQIVGFFGYYSAGIFTRFQPLVPVLFVGYERLRLMRNVTRFYRRRQDIHDAAIQLPQRLRNACAQTACHTTCGDTTVTCSNRPLLPMR